MPRKMLMYKHSSNTNLNSFGVIQINIQRPVSQDLCRIKDTQKSNTVTLKTYN